MNYKISDIYENIFGRVNDIFDNHLFIVCFLVFIVGLGTCGIWIKPIFLSGEIEWETFKKNFNTVAFVSFSAPLLSVTIFDSAVRFLRKLQKGMDSMDLDLAIWFGTLTLVLIIIILILFGLGSKEGGEFSAYSFSAWLFVLAYWALVNIDNSTYKKMGPFKPPTGTDSKEGLPNG